jgi:hypothetical protein
MDGWLFNQAKMYLHNSVENSQIRDIKFMKETSLWLNFYSDFLVLDG